MSNQPPIGVPQGAIRLNTDSQRLEFYAQDRWYEMATDVPNLAESSGASTDNIEVAGVRGMFAGGAEPSHSNIIQAFNLASNGDTFDFGNLSAARYYISGCSSRTRAVWMGGNEGSGYVDTIEFNTVSTKGDAVAFGELIGADRHFGAGFANQTRGIIAGGFKAPGQTNGIEFITISTLGNASEFGDLQASSGTYGTSGCSNSVRGIFTLGVVQPAHSNAMNFITIATLGNAEDFGDVNTSNKYGAGNTASPTRAVFGGDYPSSSNVIDYKEISDDGNALDFGDLTSGRGHFGALSNGHGGLG